MDKASLQKKTVAELRELAREIPDAKGTSSMKKDDLVDLIAAQTGSGAGGAAAGTKSLSDKSEIKRRIRDLKAKKRDALSRQDPKLARDCNRRIHHYKRMLRKLARVRAG
jgi:hypothetical protein